MLVFVRTRTATAELSEKLEARGYASAPLNGDIPQKLRERTVDHLKRGKLDILVATDVAARGLDVGRISHVVNYDIPYDTEAYVHRIGRTGRAGRHGDAILFVAPREKRLLHAIEKATRQKIEPMELPSTDVINDKRIARFKQRITDALATEELGQFYQLVEQYQHEHNKPALEIAAALAQLLQGDTPFLLQNKPQRTPDKSWNKDEGAAPRKQHARERGHRETPERPPEPGMERYRIEVGHDNQVKPGNIVGAIANEVGIDSQYMGRIDIHDEYSLIDLPEGMPKDIFNTLKKVWVSGRQLRISRVKEAQAENKRVREDTGFRARKGNKKNEQKSEAAAKAGTKGKGKQRPGKNARKDAKKNGKKPKHAPK